MTMTTVEARMTWHQTRDKVKARIKELAVTQKEVKKARKKAYPEEKRLALAKKLRPECPQWFSPQGDVITRKHQITATLNYYNELREKDYRHKIKNKWFYIRMFADLVKEFGSLEDLPNRV